MSNTTADVVGEDPRIAHLEKTKADTERELSRVVDELAHVRDVGAQALEDATAALAAEKARADVEANRAAEMEAQANAEQARADAAEQMVAELRTLVGRMEAKANAGWLDDDHACVECVGTASPRWVERWTCARHSIDAALSRTEAVAGRWVPARDLEAMRSDYQHACEGIADMLAVVRGKGNGPRRGVVEDIVDVVAERDAAIAARDEAVRESRVSEVRTQRVMLERDAAIACNEAMREPMRRLRAVVDMPAQGEGTVVDAVIARLDAADRELARVTDDLRGVVKLRDAASATRDEAVAKLTACEIAHVVEIGKVAAAERARDEAIARAEKAERMIALYESNVVPARDAAERARDEVGIQLAAAQAEIARMRPVVEAATLACHAYFVSDPEDAYTGYMQHLEAELAKLRTVPGDALAYVPSGGLTPIDVMIAAIQGRRVPGDALAPPEAAEVCACGAAAQINDGDDHLGQPVCPRCWTAERARDEVGIQLAAAQAEIARLRKRDAAFVAICLDVDNALDGSGLAPTAWLTRARLRFAAGVGPRPPSERLAEWAATIGASNASASHLDAFALDAVPGDALANVGSEPLAEVDVFRGDDGVVVVEVGCGEPVRITLPDGTHLHGPMRVAPAYFDAVKAETLASISEPMHVPTSPAGASAPASGSTPAASSATSSSSEVEGNPSAPRGTCDRITAALEASGIDASNVKEKA